MTYGDRACGCRSGHFNWTLVTVINGKAEISQFIAAHCPVLARKHCQPGLRRHCPEARSSQPLGCVVSVVTSRFSFLPPLSQQDIKCAIQLIQQAYAAPASPDDLKRLQHELFEMQKRYEAWGLIIPLLKHEDTNVQFFGAHTAQVKIARDWEQFPSQNAEGIKNVVVQLTAHAITARRSKIILRKLFVALTSLALKLVPGRLPTRCPDWIMACVTMFSGLGSPTESVHDFLAIVAEEVGSVDLLGSSKLQIQQTLTDSIPMVTHTINTTLESLPVSTALEIQSAIKCDDTCTAERSNTPEQVVMARAGLSKSSGERLFFRHLGVIGPKLEKFQVYRRDIGDTLINTMPKQHYIVSCRYKKLWAIIQPIIQKLTSALQSSVALPDQARSMAVLHLETLSGVTKGLTRINEDVFGTDDDPVVKEELEKIQNAWDDQNQGRHIWHPPERRGLLNIRNVPALKGGISITSDGSEDEESDLMMLKAARKAAMRTAIDESLIHPDLRMQVPDPPAQAAPAQSPTAEAAPAQAPPAETASAQVSTGNKQQKRASSSSAMTAFDGDLTPPSSPAPKRTKSSTDKTVLQNTANSEKIKKIRRSKRKNY
ncbi:hypothetical protein JOM56_012657 [Amanita muscaria]